MLWKKDKLRPTQPYFVLDSKNFRQEVYLQQGISHFYTFEVEKSQVLNAVPDACIDLFFEYTEGGLEAFACGTPLRFVSHEWRGRREVFGVRFMPGVQPELLRMKMKDLVDKRVDFADGRTDRFLSENPYLSSTVYKDDASLREEKVRREDGAYLGSKADGV